MEVVKYIALCLFVKQKKYLPVFVQIPWLHKINGIEVWIISLNGVFAAVLSRERMFNKGKAYNACMSFWFKTFIKLFSMNYYLTANSCLIEWMKDLVKMRAIYKKQYSKKIIVL